MKGLNKTEPIASYGFGPMVEECKRRGIGRTTAFDLAAKGLIQTFTIGRRRFVRIASLEALPDLLASNDASAGPTPPCG